MATFSFRATEEHMVQGFDRFRSAKKVPLYLWPIKSLCFLGLAALLALTLVYKVWVPAAVLAFFIVLLLSGPRFDYWWFKRQLRKSPFYRSNVEVVLSDEGCVATDQNSKVELKWVVFNKATRFSDGFLLLIGSQQFYWWPISSLVEGTTAEVHELLKRNIRSYRDA